MKFVECEIPGAWVIEADPHRDDRGNFFRLWCSDEFEKRGIEFVPVQANMGFSHRRGTTRGLHYQVAPAQEAKLVRCTQGAMYDVVVDLRPESPAYCRWFGIELNAHHHRTLFVPEGCAHGYQTLEDATGMFYLTSAAYAPAAVRGARYDDPAFGISWPLQVSRISDQDQKWLAFQREER
jgi:dTDP-4-dehydrorhamnose 3,5-epimerase